MHGFIGRGQHQNHSFREEPQVAVIGYKVPGSVELVLEAVLAVSYIGGLANIAAVEEQAGPFEEHVAPGRVADRQVTTVHTPGSGIRKIEDL